MSKKKNHPLTSGPVAADTVLKSALGADLKDAVVCGWTQDGKLYFAASDGEMANVNMTLDLCKRWLLSLTELQFEQLEHDA